VASEVERGNYVLAPRKSLWLPLREWPARGFELDLYDGNLFLIGDAMRL